MKLAAAQSLVAWIWSEQPGLASALLTQLGSQKLGCFCIGCIGDFLDNVGCAISDSGGDSLSTGISTIGACDLTTPSLSCDGSTLSCINISDCFTVPTLTACDLTQVNTSPVTGCNVNLSCATDASTSSALSNLANSLTSAAGLSALAKVVAAYFTSEGKAATTAAAKTAAATQAAVTSTQIARATTGQSALPITYSSDGSASISTTAGSVPLTQQILDAFTPNSIEVFFAQYGDWLLVGGAAAVLLYAATRKRV